MIFRFDYRIIFLLLLYYINYHSVNCKDTKWFNFTVEYHSGESTCTTCQQNILVDHFACSNDAHRSKWESGIRRFKDPIEFGYIVNQVYVELLGAFHCFPTGQDAKVRIYLNDFAQSTIELPAIPYTGCFCPTCNAYFDLPPSKEQNHGWPSYNYTGDNFIQVAVLNELNQSICLSDVNIKFLTRRVFPKLISVKPDIAPYQSNTTVIVKVDYFDEDVRYICDFGFADSISKRIDSEHLSCKVPPLPELNIKDVNLRIMPEWADRTQSHHRTLNFSYYDEPKITGVYPLKGTYGDVITLKGYRFFNSTYLACTFNNVFSNVTFISKNEIRCTVPEIHITHNNGNGHNLVISISQNGQQISDSEFIFFYSSNSDLPNEPDDQMKQKPTMRWLILGAFMAALLVVIVITLFVCFKKRSNDLGYEKIGSVESISINREDLDIRERIGRGSFGDIHRGYWRSTEVAIKKILLTNPSFIKELIKEATIMKNLRHPNILSILGYCTIPPDVCIVMEYMPLGSLYEILHSNIELPWYLLKRIAIDAAKGMNYLHKSDPVVIHRDLKSQNLLVDEHYRVKVSDFGLSKLLDKSGSPQTMTICGTPIWTAPEILKSQRYSEKADVYSFGICLWEMYAREDPYKGISPYQVMVNIVRNNLRPEIKDDCPLEWASLMKECWDEDPDKRPTFEEIIFKLENMSLPLD